MCSTYTSNDVTDGHISVIEYLNRLKESNSRLKYTDKKQTSAAKKEKYATEGEGANV